ncbi:MAG: alanine/ornithine racemase family PLP-dependent enzyme [Acidimicrobiales bacterium]
MTGLRLVIDLDKIADNARQLVTRTARRGISVTAVTKAMLGAPELAGVLGAAAGLGDSRIENIERMRHAGVDSPMLLLRSPVPSQIRRVVDADTMSVNTELDVLSALSCAARAAGRVHDVLVMVELGDLREGVMPADLDETIRHVVRLPALRLRGLGANLACRNGIEPSDENMGELTAMVESVEASFGVELDTVSGGNSANLDWALGPGDTGRVNNLRLGESILLGREPLQRRPIAGLHTDAITLVAEVIECHRKPTRPWGRAGQNSFGETPEIEDRGETWQVIVAMGRQDTDPGDLIPPDGLEILAASSDHLILAAAERLAPGHEIRFLPGYSALLRSMTSPFVVAQMLGGR